MSYLLLALLLVVIGLLFAWWAVKTLFRRDWFLGWLRGMSGTVLFLAMLLFLVIGVDVYSYQQITSEQNIATISFEQTDQQRFTASFSAMNGEVQQYDLYGDQWQLDSRIIKWHNILSFLGMKTGYRLDRLGGRYLSLADERNKPRSLYDLTSSVTPLDFWKWLEPMETAIVDARYGNSTFLPMVNGAQYQVNITVSGIIARPLNTTAREAIANWQ